MIGTTLSRRFRIAGLVGAYLCLLTGSAQNSAAQDGKSASGYAIIGGTVFNERGFTVRGATVSLSPADPSKLNKQITKQLTKQQAKKQEAVTDARGEFAFRVAPIAADWVLRVTAKGMQTVEKTVDVEGEVRKDVTFELSAESK